MTDLTERHVHVDGDSWDITEIVGATALGVAPVALIRLHSRLEGDAR